MNFEILKYNIYDLPTGARTSTCPKCSHTRKHNSKQKCLLLDWERGLGTCQHCGSVVQLHEYNYNSNNIGTTNMMPKIEPKTRLYHCFESDVLPTLNAEYFPANNFINHLAELLDDETFTRVVNDYKIGTSKRWNGANVFWLIDEDGNVCHSMIMLFYKDRFNRNKDGNYQNTLASIKKDYDSSKYYYKTCFFGLHLINEDDNRNKKIVIVESQKTAILFASLFPNVVVVASNGLHNFKEANLVAMKGRNILAYPDLSKNGEAFKLWNDTAIELNKKGYNIKVSDLLENYADDTARENKDDIGDYLIKKLSK